jgi:hypothetical protein
MDLVQDRYYGLGPESAAIWRSLEQGVPFEGIGLATGVLSPQFVSELVARQLEAWQDAELMTSGEGRPEPLPIGRPTGSASQVGLNLDRIALAGFSLPLLMRLIHAQWWTRRSLGGKGIGGTLKAIQAIPAAPPQGNRADGEVLYRMVHAYYSSRRLWRQGKGDCLPRSLALATALRWVGVDANVCFGVRKSPFQAHAWVEADGLVVNETPDRVEPFTVIARF